MPIPTTRPSSMTTIWSACGDRRNALRHNHHRRIGGHLAQRGADSGVGVHIERREGVVEQVDGRPADDRARDRQPLPLPAGEVDAALGYRHAQPVGVGADEVVGRRHPQRLPHLVVGRIGLAVAQVLGDRAGEQVAALRHQADRRPQLLGVVVANVDAVDAHRPAGDVVQPADQRYQCRLARTGRAHDGRCRAGSCRQRNILQHSTVSTGIAERRRFQADLAVDGGGTHRVFGAGDAWRRGQHLADPFGAHRRARQQHQHERRQQHGHQDLHEVGQERDQRAHLHLAGVDPQAAEPDQRDAGNVDHQRGHRQHQRLPAACVERGVGQRLIGLGESVALEGFPRERADHADARELLAHHSVDAVDQPLHAPEDRQQVRHDPVVGDRQHRHADEQQP